MDRKIETWKQKGRKAQVGKLGKKIRSGLARNFQNAKIMRARNIQKCAIAVRQKVSQFAENIALG